MARWAFIFVTAIVSFTSGAPAASTTLAGLQRHLQTYAHLSFDLHAKQSGLATLIRPLGPAERQFQNLITKRFGQNVTDAETHLLFRHPSLDLNVKRVHDAGYALSTKFCGTTDWDSNEVDSTRHFTSSFMLSMLVGQKLAYQYLTAHESSLAQCYTGKDCDLSLWSTGQLASTVMDLHNNLRGLIAAENYRSNLSWGDRLLGPSFAQIQRAAYEALATARQQQVLFAWRTTPGVCEQPSQNESFRKFLRVPLDAPISYELTGDT